MVIVGVLLILAVALDAWRRIRAEKRDRVRVKLVDPDQLPAEPEDDFALFKELPNGPARVRPRGEVVRQGLEAAGEGAGSGAQAAGAAPGGQSRSPHNEFVNGRNCGANDGGANNGSGNGRLNGRTDDEDIALVSGLTSSGVIGKSENLDWLDEVGESRPLSAATRKLPLDAASEVHMLNVVARSPRGFRGEDILEILLACDLRFGDMSFFHRHEEAAGKGPIQFSVANMVDPGVFNIDDMSNMTTPGLIFFVSLPGPEDMMQAYDYMLETAQVVARNLGGDVLDESRSVLTKQSMDHCRHQIRDLERRLLARAQ